MALKVRQTLKDAAFLLTVGSFLFTVALFYLQLAIVAFLLTVGAFLLTIFPFFAYSWSFFAYSGKVRPIRALRDCKPRSLTVSNKAPTVSKKDSSKTKSLLRDWHWSMDGSSHEREDATELVGISKIASQ